MRSADAWDDVGISVQMQVQMKMNDAERVSNPTSDTQRCFCSSFFNEKWYEATLPQFFAPNMFGAVA